MTQKLVFDHNGALLRLCGPENRYLKAISTELGIQLSTRGNEVMIEGPQPMVSIATELIKQLYALAQQGRALEGDDVVRAAKVLADDPSCPLTDIFSDAVLSTTNSSVTPKGLAQKRYVEAIRQHDIVFGIGPAGTGKTYLAMAMAVAALIRREVKRIVLTRPAIEAGEKLGFLPGTLAEKVNPYLRPLYDALNDMMDFDKAQQLIDRGQIEVAPLAFMRGRTLNASFVILDEAQNTTREQMLMFLTRLGYGAKAVITGDLTQVDLPNGAASGLLEARQVLSKVTGIAFCAFSDRDVVRHPLVQKIILAYQDKSSQ